MATPEENHPAILFIREHPELAAQARQMVHDWFELALDLLSYEFPDHISTATAGVLYSFRASPQDAYINNLSLEYVNKKKRMELADAVGNQSKVEFFSTFLTWRLYNFDETESSQQRDDVENIATRHINYWLRAALPQHPEYKGILRKIDINLNAFEEGDTEDMYFESAEFLGCIESAILEKYISDTYAPRDLFGPVQ